MKLPFAVATCILASVVLPVTLASHPSGLEVEGQKGGLARSIDGYLERCEANGWSGSVLLAKGGKVVLAKGYGLSSREAKRKNSEDTIFEIASATKPFTACAIMKLVEQSKVRLEDPISKHLPGVPADKEDITVQHLLTHTSGMARRDVGGSGEDLESAVRAYLSPDRSRPSGAVHEYWNGGYALLAGIVAVASGKSYQAYLEEHLFAPAEMEQTGFAGDTDLARGDQAVGYSGGKLVRLAAEHAYGSYGYQYRGMGGMVTNATDLWKFTRALDAGRILKPETIALMETAVIDYRGLGWAVAVSDRKTRKIGHSGDVRGFHSQFQRFPDEGAVVIVLSNVDGVPLHAISGTLESMLLGGASRYPAPPEIVTLKGRDLDKLVGNYQSEDGKQRLSVARSGNSLLISRVGEGTEPQRPGVAPFTRVQADELVVERGLDKEAKIAKSIVEAVDRGDAEFIRKVLMKGIPSSWPNLLTSQIWAKQISAHGALTGAEVVGARTLGRKRVELVFELSHEERSRQLKLVLQDERLNIFQLEEGGAGAATLEGAIETANRALQATIDGDIKYLQSILLPSIPSSWPGRLVGTYWPDHVKKYGAFEGHEVLGAKTVGIGRFEILIGLSQKDEDRTLKVVIDGGKLNIFDLAVERTAGADTYRPLSKTQFTMFEWTGPPRFNSVAFEFGRRAVKGLEWRPKSGRAIRYTRDG